MRAATITPQYAYTNTGLAHLPVNWFGCFLLAQLLTVIYKLTAFINGTNILRR